MAIWAAEATLHFAEEAEEARKSLIFACRLKDLQTHF
jgi:hypothetical protein